MTAEPVPGTMPSMMPMTVPRISTAGYFKVLRHPIRMRRKLTSRPFSTSMR